MLWLLHNNLKRLCYNPSLFLFPGIAKYFHIYLSLACLNFIRTVILCVSISDVCRIQPRRGFATNIINGKSNFYFIQFQSVERDK